LRQDLKDKAEELGLEQNVAVLARANQTSWGKFKSRLPRDNLRDGATELPRRDERRCAP